MRESTMIQEEGNRLLKLRRLIHKEIGPVEKVNGFTTTLALFSYIKYSLVYT